MKHAYVYLREALRWRRRFPGCCRVAELKASFPDWRRSLRPGANALSDALPWMTYGAIRFLEGILRSGMRVFEYGAGGSSLFLSPRVAQVVSVEHDPLWADRVREGAGKRNLRNLTLLQISPERLSAADPDPADLDGYGTSDTSLAGHTFRRYAGSIDAYPEGHFQVVIIDGRSRPSCFKHAFQRVGASGWLVLDNAERPHYWRILDSLHRMGWPQSDFAGPGPYNAYFWRTCVWQRPT